MPNAKFVADFTSFDQAVQKSSVTLKNLEADSNKVAASLNRMVDNFSGRKLINDAVLMTKAVEDVGGATALTAKEMARVNATVTEAIAKYTALGKTAPQSMTDLAAATKATEIATTTATKSTSALSGWFTTLGTQVASVAAGFISAQAIIGGVQRLFGLLVDTVKVSVKAYADAEASQSKLVAALRAQHLATPDVISQYNKLASQFQTTTVFSDDMINSMQALLVQVGSVMPSQMGKALQASTDLAAGLGIDLETATTLVAKAAAGHTETLGRYGIQVSEAALESKGFEAVLEAVNRQFGGQAAAEIETYAGKVKQAANAWNNLQEMLGKSIIQNPLVEAGIMAINRALGEADTKTGEWKLSLQNLFDIMDKSGTAGNLARLFEVYVDGVNAVTRAQARLLAMPSPFKKTIDEMQSVPDPGGLAYFKAINAAEDATRKLATETKKIPPTLDELNNAMGRVVGVTEDESDALFTIAKVTDTWGLGIGQLNSRLVTITDTMHELNPALTDLVTGFEDVDRAMQGTQRSHEALLVSMNKPMTLPDVKPAMDEIGGAFESLKGMAGSVLGGLNDIFQRAFEGGGNIMGAIKSFATNALKVALSFIPVVGPFISQFAGAIVAGFDKLFGGIFKSAEKAMNKVRQTFVDAAGGLDALRDKATAAGVTIDALLNAKNAKQYEKAIKDLNQAFADTQTELEGIDKLKDRFATIGGALSDSMRDALRGLASIPGLSSDAAAALMGLANDTKPNFQELEKTAADYGITLSQLGSKFQQAHVSDEAAKIIGDFENLTNAGADVGNVINGMAGAVQRVVDESAKFGVDVPENMRPMIEAMINAGLLTDAAGKKITDISKIKFGAPVETEADKIAKAIKDLGELFEKLPTIMADAVKGINSNLSNINTRIDVDVYTHHHDVYDNVAGAAMGGLVTATGVQNFAGGGRVLAFRPRGTDTVPAMLTPGEGVLTRAEMHALGGVAGFKSLREVLRTGGSGGDSGSVETKLDEIKAELRRNRLTGPAALARAVRDEVQKSGGRRR
jgi:uncharacterized protein YoxC